MPARQPTSGGFMSGLSQLMGGKAPMPQPGQVGSATGATPNIGGFPGAAFKKGGKVKAKPVAKKAGGKVAAKPVMKKAGGRVAAKPKMKRK
jgi:hypothetical protein